MNLETDARPESRTPAPTIDPLPELLSRLNAGWRLAGPSRAGASLPQRLLYAIRRAVGVALAPQQRFNATVVQFLNAATPPSVEFSAALDDLRRTREALAARDLRMEATLARLLTEVADLKTGLGVLQQATHQLAREAHAPAEPRTGDAAPEAPGAALAGPDALSYRYVGFEDRFRGDPAVIASRLESYVPLFAGARDVLDIGCGRGEFLALLAEQGISARGIDLNDAMVERCRERGLTASRTDALPYLESVPDGSLGGLFAAQVVEHLEPAYLTHLLDAAFRKLRPGSRIVLETINPACWFAFFESYIRDITHVRPLHPDTLRFLLVAAGFQDLEIQYRVPYPEHDKLQPIPSLPVLGDVAERLNANVQKLNALLFTNLDYAAIGRRP